MSVLPSLGSVVRASGVVALLCLSATACRARDTEMEQRKRDAKRALAELERRLAERQAPKPATPVVPDAGAAAARGDAPEAPPAAPASRTPASAPPPASTNAPFIADEPVRIADPGPATATAKGVLMNTREGGLVLAELGRRSAAAAPGRTPVRPISGDEGPFALVRGPSPFGDLVYWVSHGSLVRRRIGASGEPGPLEFLARDALDGTRVAVPLGAPGRTPAKIPATVAYVARPAKEGDPFLAKLWVEGSEPQLLTAEGNGAHSVSLVQTSDGVLALSVQARMAMTPVHARSVRFDAGRPVLADDVVVWVGGGIQPLTEMAVLPDGEQGLFGFIAHERSMEDFGVAELDIGMRPTMDTKTSWLLYPNGIDPAPVAAGHACGKAALLYAAPETAAPHVEQELVLRALGDGAGEERARVATAQAFYFVSLATLDDGALAVWVTGDGTWAATVRCKPKPK